MASGHKMVPPAQYPGDDALHTLRGIALTAQEQFNQQGQVPTTNPQPLMQGTPGGGYVGLAGAQGAGAVTATPFAPPGQQGSTSYNDALGASESGNNPAAVNAGGYSGQFQFGTGRLKDLGFYRPAAGEDSNANTWQGTFNIPGYPQVKTQADFLHNVSAQNAVQAASSADIRNQIAQTPGAQAYDPNGLAAVAHLGGIGGMRKFVATGGQYNPNDGRTSLMDYYQRFSSPGGLGQRPIQVAAATPMANGQPVASDVSSVGPATPAAAPQGQQTGLQSAIDRLRNAPTQAASDDASQPAAPPPAPLNSLMPATAGAAPAGPVNQLSPLMQPQPGSTGAPAGMGQPNALLPPSMQQSSASPQPPDGLQFLYRGGALMPVPEQPGYAYGRTPTGQTVAMRIPGSPGKGVKTQIVGGHIINTDEQTGALVSDTPGAPDASRTTTVPGPNGTIIMQSGRQIGIVPFSTQPAQIAAYQRDSDVATQIAKQNSAAEQQLQQTLEARNLARGLPTGAGGESRAAISSWLKTYAPDSVYQAATRTGFLPTSPEAEQAAKLLLRQAATDEQQLGGSGGLGMTEKFQKANPSLNMQPESIQAISNLKAVTAQAAKDYGDGATAYFNQQQDNILHQGGQYAPLSNFNQQWFGQRNVQTYMGAVDALNAKSYAVWSKGLSPEDQDRALQIIGRIDPTTVVNGPRGPIGVAKGGGAQGAPATTAPAQSAAPAVGTVMQGYRFNGGDPANPGSWARVQ